ncbi:hypothetical protein A6A04_15935 [Paramagnetospirillum marisnigri]|uniref:Methyl-accepting transducer domain-containing protein n=1 Tax=Paramagnetospirillum marisnigri TaxID=1285242 RepID=A0A178MRR0_9PROT|nr:bacteriohemerythrin [Paramagnetospirillum marisnigri]OAN51410.1 hypothetical protein A6A04_15935 [Paramagnetospirillum marisnigri]
MVANEVKHLATQTGRATEEIAAQIRAVQEGTSNAVRAIDSISQVINQMGEISSSVASAVQEQSAATAEIARNVEQAAAGTAEVSSSVVAVEQAARDTGGAAEHIHTSASDLSRQAEYLRAEVGRFLSQVRAEKSEMKLLEWDNALNMGIAAIDRHHQEMFAEVNRLYSEMMSGGGQHAAQSMIDMVDNVLTAHFKEEEEVMNRHGYGEIDAHRRHHRDFLDTFAKLRGTIGDGKPDAVAKMFEYVSNWLKNHIRIEDGKLATYLRDRKAA